MVQGVWFSLIVLFAKLLFYLINQNKGIIFIIRSLSGRLISAYSKYPIDEEVVFLPGSIFQITNHYIADQICLAQANIRNTTFKLDPNDSKLDKIIRGQNAIIIELLEII